MSTSEQKNVGTPERVLSSVVGSAMLLKGIRRGGWLGWLTAGLGGTLVHRGATGRCKLYERLSLNTTRESYERGIEVRRTITIARPAEEVYRLWRDVERLPEIFEHLESVTPVNETVSRWRLRERGATIQWLAEITADEPGRRIAFHTLPDSDIRCAGEILFERAPGERGTEAHLAIRFSPPGGSMTMMLEPVMRRIARHQLGQEMARLKQVLETGEIATSETLSPARRAQLARGRASEHLPPPEHAEEQVYPPAPAEVRP